VRPPSHIALHDRSQQTRISSLIRSRYPMVLCAACLAAKLSVPEAEIKDALQTLIASVSGVLNPRWGAFTIRQRRCEGCGLIGDHVGATR
jgi:hypothetical protein